MAGEVEFEAAARELRATVGGTRSVFATEHLGTAMDLAMALFSRAEDLNEDEYSAIRSSCNSASDEQALIGLALALRRLVDVVVRDRMTFLLVDSATIDQNEAAATSALQKQALVHQRALRELLPPSLEQQIRAKLCEHWDALLVVAASTKLSLPRIRAADWKVVTDPPPAASTQQPLVLLRLQTSDGRTRRVQVPLREFHRLRHSAAKVLQEMNHVEAHPIMRLAYMEQLGATDAQPAGSSARVP